MATKHPRTQARQAAALTLQQAAAQIGLKPKSLEHFETTPNRTLRSALHRARAAQIYGRELVGETKPGCQRGALPKPCGTCGKPVTRAQRFGTKPHLPAIPGKRFCSYPCRKNYGVPRAAAATPVVPARPKRELSAETRAINELLAINKKRKND